MVGGLPSIFLNHPMTNLITRHTLSGKQRSAHVATLFGARFLWIESFVFDTAGSLSTQYSGGSWAFYALSNGGFFLAPSSISRFEVRCDNGYQGSMSGEAFGITCCLYAYSMLSFSPDAAFAECCASMFHLLRDFAIHHPDAAAIFAAID